MEPILLYIIIISVTIYLFNILRFIIGINKPYELLINNEEISISIIIPVKNGSDNAARMFDNLLKQEYSGNMEFLIVDDNSTDDTKKIINNYSEKDTRFKYVQSKDGLNSLNHKKRALDAGIQIAQYEYLLFTDIDCIIQSKWVESMAKYFAQNIDYIIGYTYIDNNHSLLNKFQCIDLKMLLFASYGSTVINAPWACSGQNQAYTKKLYNNIGGFEPLSQYLQGDDTLFLQLALKHGAKIIFNNNPYSYVISRTEINWSNLLLQRARWSGDANVMWKFNLYFYLAALATFSINVLIITLGFTSYFKIGLLILSLKILFEMIMYTSGTKKLQHQNKNYIDFICWSLIVPIYTITMGFASFFHIRWKGESIK